MLAAGGARTWDVVSGEPIFTRDPAATNNKQNWASPIGRKAIYSTWDVSQDPFMHRTVVFAANEPWSFSCWLWMDGQYVEGGQRWFGNAFTNLEWIQFDNIVSNLCVLRLRGLGSEQVPIRFVQGFPRERRWWHVVVAYDGGTDLKGWGNGFEAVHLNAFVPDQMTFNSIGKPWGNSRLATGAFDDFRIYSRCLTAGDARAIYENGNELYQRPVEYFLLPTGPAPTPDLAADVSQTESLIADLTVEAPDVDLAADLSQSESLTADLTVELASDTDLAADLSQSESFTADLTIETPGLVDLAANLSQAESLTADLTLTTDLAADLSQSEALTANLTVDVPGLVDLAADLGQSEALTADLTVELPPPDLDAALQQSESLTATLTIEGAVAVTAVHYRADAVVPYFSADNILPHYRA